MEVNKNVPKELVFSMPSPVMSSHSGDWKEYLPSMMLRIITICLRCQKGGHPTSLPRESCLRLLEWFAIKQTLDVTQLNFCINHCILLHLGSSLTTTK